MDGQLSKPSYESLERRIAELRDSRRSIRDALAAVSGALHGVLEGDLVLTGRTVASALELADVTLNSTK